MALRALVKANSTPASSPNEALHLFRRVLREMPRILTIYDIDLSVVEARQCVREAFREKAWVKDERTIEILCHKGKIELEETILQYKTKSQLMSILEPRLMSPKQEKALRGGSYESAIIRGFGDQYKQVHDL